MLLEAAQKSLSNVMLLTAVNYDASIAFLRGQGAFVSCVTNKIYMKTAVRMH